MAGFFVLLTLSADAAGESGLLSASAQFIEQDIVPELLLILRNARRTEQIIRIHLRIDFPIVPVTVVLQAPPAQGQVHPAVCGPDAAHVNESGKPFSVGEEM